MCMWVGVGFGMESALWVSLVTPVDLVEGAGQSRTDKI